MQQELLWITALLAIVAVGLGAGFAGFRFLGERHKATKPLPTEWALTARPVFNTDERRVYRQLREALPHHIVLAKLPLVRLCQPTDPQQVRYWFDLLGSTHATFAVCSANGRVLAAVDLDTERTDSRRVLQIKQAVLAACRVRYLRCQPQHLPSIAELQLLVPQSGAIGRAPNPAPSLHSVRDNLATTVATKRKERSALWNDSGFFHDSFFAPEGHLEGGPMSEFGPHSLPPQGSVAPQGTLPASAQRPPQPATTSGDAAGALGSATA